MRDLLQPRLLAVLLTILFALVGGACGGDGDAAADDFIDEADAICTDAEDSADESEKTIESYLDPETKTELSDVVDELGEFEEDVKEALDELRELDPPSDVEDDWQKLLSLFDEELDDIGDLRELARSRERASTSFQEDVDAIDKFVSASRFEDRADDEEALADDIGLQDCGEEN